MKLVLEPRFLFDGSVSETASSASVHHHHHHHQHHASSADGGSGGDQPSADAHHFDDSQPSVASDAHPAAVSNPTATQVLFVDPRVANWQQLVKGVASDVAVVVIDPTSNGIDQVGAALVGRHNLVGLQFLTNGGPGSIELGSTAVNAASLMAQSDAVSAWADHLASHAGIALWGSEVGSGNAGTAFLADLHSLTGADVGAASHAVGSADMGASWVLDAKVGTFDLVSPFAATAIDGIPSEILTHIPALATNMAATDLIFIDPRVAGWDQLAAGADANAQVILIDPSRDAVGQITSALQGRSGVTAINLVAYGSAGALDIGSTPLSAALVTANAAQIAGWSSHLGAGADINLWGCDVAQGDGRALLAGLASLTGADVAASTGLVGNALFGGSWTLNTASGALEAVAPFDLAARANFSNILDPANLTVTMTADKVTAQGGDTITYTIVIGNPSSHSDPAGDTLIDLKVLLSNNVSVVAASLVQTAGPLVADARTSDTEITINTGTLASGETLTFTIAATVKSNLPANTPIFSSATTEYTANFNTGINDTSNTTAPNAGLDGLTASTTAISYVPAFTSGVSLIGESNLNNATLAAIGTPQTAVSATIGDIVRVHAYVQVPVGQNPNSILDVALPTGLAYQADGSAEISLVTPGGAMKSSTIDPTASSAAQVAEGAIQIDPTKTAAVAAPATLATNTDTSTASHVKFNLGTLTNNSNSSVASYILIDFNAIVQNVAANVTGTTANVTATINSGNVAGASDQVSYSATVPLTSTELSAADATLNLPLFNTALGTLNKLTMSVSAVLDLISGSATDNQAVGSPSLSGSGGARSTFTITSQAGLTLPGTLKPTVTAEDPNSYTLSSGQTQVFNPVVGSTLLTRSSTTVGTLSQYNAPTSGATTPFVVSTATFGLSDFSGGNASISQVTKAAATLTVTYTFTDKPSTALASSAATITVVEPKLTLAKTVTGVAADGTITFQDVITNTGNATAYGATLSDPEASSNAGAISILSKTGAATGAAGTGAPTFAVSGGNSVTGTYALAAGASETITYTVAVTDRTAALPNATATLNWNSLNGGQQTAFGTTNGVVGSLSGSRTDPVTGSGLAAVNTYTTNVTLGFGAVSGQIWDELGPFSTVYAPTLIVGGDADTALNGVVVSATGLDPNTGAPKTTTTTTVGGKYAFSPGVFGAGAVTVTVPSPGSTGGPGATETLVYNANGAVTANPATATATIAIGTANTGLNFIYQKPDVAPVITGWGGTNIAENGTTPVLLKGAGAGVASTPINTLGGNYVGTVLTVQRTGGANATDVFSGDGTLTLVGTAVTLGGVQIGTFTQTGGALVITFNTAATVTAGNVAGVLDHLQYNNTQANALQNGVSISASLNDSNTTSYAAATGGQPGSPGFNLGTGGPLNSNTVVATINIAPAALSVTFTKPNDIAPATNAVILNSTLAVSVVPDSVTLAITAGFKTGEDTLTVPSAALGTTLSASYNAATGVMTITKIAGQTPTAADWQAALRGVQFIDTNPIPNTPARTVTATYTTGSVVTTSTETVNVVDLDSSPILGSGSASLGSSNTLTTAAPVGAVGTLVSSLLTSVGVTDPDGNSQTNGGTPVTGGLSVVATDTSKGNWWYSTNGGTSWTQFAGGVLPAISATNSLHLVGDANTRVYFQPNVGAAAGTVATALTFRAWDQYDAVGNGTLSAIPTDGTLGGPSATGPNALAFSYSSTTAVVPITLYTPGGALSGRAWDRLGPAASTAFGATGDVDNALVGVTVSATGPKPDGTAGTVTATTTTDASGNYSFAAGTFGVGTVTVTMPSSGAGSLPAAETLVYDAFGTLPANPGTASVTLTTATTTGVNFIYEKPDVAPVLGGWGGTNIQETGTTPVSLKGLGATVADTPLTTLGGGTADYGGTILTIARTGGANAADTFSGDATLGLAAATVKLGAVTVGSFTQAGGSLVITFATGTTTAQVASVLDHLQYANSAANTLQNGISISASLNDHNTTAYSAAPGSIAGSPGFNLGTGGALNSNTIIATVNVVPTLAAVTFTKPNDIAPATNAVALDSTLVVATAPDSVSLAITGGFRTGEDTLTVASAALGAKLTASYNATTGVMTITNVTGQTPTAADWQTALRGVQFIDTNPIPNLPARTVTASFTTAGVTTTSTEAVNVIDLDSSPILGAGAATLGASGTFAYAPPTGAVGTLVSSLLTQVGVTDPDGNSQTNGGTPATGGLSVVAVDTSKGSWWYSTNGGTTWTQFAGGGQTAISATNSLHLVGDASTRVYFQPNVGAAAGTVPAALTFRAWDQYDAVGNGVLSAIPTDGVLGGPSATGPNALAFSYSSTTAVVPVSLVAPTGSVSGRVWDVLGPASLTHGAAGDVVTDLGGITVTATYTDALSVVRTVTTTTASDGTYTFAAGTLPDGAVTITLPTPGSAGLSAAETLVLQQIGSVGAGAATSSVTLAGAAVSNVNFIYEKPDVAPSLGTWGGTGIAESGATAVPLKGLGGAVSDTPITTLGGDYGGTILTVARTGTPVATDVFAGSGTVTLTGSTVSIGGTSVGSFTQSGGSLAITFATGTTAAQASTVLNAITYSNTAAVTTLGQTASITATLNDHNTTLYTGIDAGSTGRNLGISGPLTGSAVATVALNPAGSISGRVWDVLGPASLTHGAAGDVVTDLSGITVTASYVSGGVTHTVTTTTAADGTYSFAPGSLPDGTVTITLPTPGSAGLSAAENLVLQQIGSVGTGAATSTITLAGGPVANVNFIYEKTDTAPVIANWGGSVVTESGPTPVALKGTLATAVTDTPIDTLGGNYGGTVLTVARTGGPVGTDVFSGSGTLTLAGGNVVLGGVTIGTFTQSGGSLAITFANATTAVQVGQVLDGLHYSDTAPINDLGTSVSITASLNDNNTTLYTGIDPHSPGRNLGVNGPLIGTVVVTIALSPSGSLAGTVWDELGPATETDQATGDVDIDLSGVTVTASYTTGGVVHHVTTTTASDGTYLFAPGTLPDGVITITLPAPGTSSALVNGGQPASRAGLNSSETLVLQTVGKVGTGVGTSTVSLNENAIGGINYVYQQPDIAPVITNWGGTGIAESGSTPVFLKAALATGVSDIPIAELGGNYGGTFLTVARTGGAVATDQFSAGGALAFTGGNAVLNGTVIGTVAQSAGSIVITFADGVTNTQVAGVLDGLKFANTAPVTTLGQTASVTATLNDNNTTLYSALDAQTQSLGRNLGTGGPLVATAVATVALAPDGSVSGRVWDTLGPANLTYGAPGDVVTNLGGITVTATYVSGGVTSTVTTTTAADGTYSFAPGTLPDGPVTISLPRPGSAGLSAAESLVLQQIGTVGSGPATSAINLSGGPVANVNFIYEKPDIAPTISGWGGTNIPENGSTPVPLKGLGASVTDTPINALGGNYGGTVLTVQRTTGPNATDLFGGDTSLLITGGTVTLGNTLIGTYTQSGGSLVITFANTITAPQVAGVLDHLTYVNTNPDASAVSQITVGASLNDHNTTSYGGGSPGFNLGTGGPAVSNLVTATIAITPLPPTVPILTPPLPPEPPDPVEKFGQGSGNRNLIQDRPGRPENWLVGSDVRRFIIANQHAVEPLPPDMFYDTDPAAQLTLDAVQSDGRPLPDWLIFDARARVFYGTPPATFHGRVDIAITATDDQGHRAQGEYRILVGRDLAALQELLQPPSRERPLPTLDVKAAPLEPPSAPLQAAAVGRTRTAHMPPPTEPTGRASVASIDRLENAVDTTSFFAALSQQSSNGGARAGFSQQLRDAGRSGRLGQARALLRTLDQTDAKRPAA